METLFKTALVGLLLAVPLSSSAQDYNEKMHFTAHETHALNDRWLGMPVETKSGLSVGHIVDAPVAENGQLIEIMVDTSGSEVSGVFDVIFVDPEWIKLYENRVEVDRGALTPTEYS